MWTWLRLLFKPGDTAPVTAPLRPLATPTVAPVSRTPDSTEPGTSAATEPGSIDAAFFAWLLGSPIKASPTLGAHELRALAHLEQLAADPEAHKRLLPRTAAVVPQLLARLRDDSTPLADLTAQVARDVTLVAEVVRMANSPVYRRHEAVVELGHAVRLLGAEGLRRAIARAVLQPLINVRGSAFVSQCAQRLWLHSEKKAQLCAALAKNQGVDAFEGYLLGLAHNAAWSAALRGVDSSQPGATWRSSAGFATALAARRDALFAIIARQWQLSAGLQGLAQRIASHGLQDHRTALPPLGEVLRSGDLLATIGCAALPAEAGDVLLQQQPLAVRECFAQLQSAGSPADAPASASAQTSKCSPAAAHTTSSAQIAHT
jgi:HDOD domain